MNEQLFCNAAQIFTETLFHLYFTAFLTFSGLILVIIFSTKFTVRSTSSAIWTSPSRQIDFSSSETSSISLQPDVLVDVHILVYKIKK